MEAKTTVQERIKMVCDKYFGGTILKMSKFVGLPYGTVNGIATGKTKNVTSKTFDAILAKLPKINSDWLKSGKGEMEIGNDMPSNVHIIKYFPNVTCNMGNNDTGSIFDNNSYENMIIPGYSDCQYAINATGDSMSPLIKPGNIVLLSAWNESFIEWGEIYLITTRNGYTTIKRVFPSQKEGYIECRSENPDNPPFDVEAGENLLPMYVVKGWIKHN